MILLQIFKYNEAVILIIYLFLSSPPIYLTLAPWNCNKSTKVNHQTLAARVKYYEYYPASHIPWFIVAFNTCFCCVWFSYSPMSPSADGTAVDSG
jgi:hypothetical protein